MSFIFFYNLGWEFGVFGEMIGFSEPNNIGSRGNIHGSPCSSGRTIYPDPVIKRITPHIIIQCKSFCGAREHRNPFYLSLFFDLKFDLPVGFVSLLSIYQCQKTKRFVFRSDGGIFIRDQEGDLHIGNRGDICSGK